MQSKLQLEQWYDKKDPWGYKTNPDDKYRKEVILDACGGTWNTALDIGAGEGWLTKDIKAKKLYGLEISDTAANRFPKKVERVDVPEGKYELVLCAGMLYKQYNYPKFTEWILEHTSHRAVIAGIDSWLKIDPRLQEHVVKEQLFPYREYKQRVLTLMFNY